MSPFVDFVLVLFNLICIWTLPEVGVKIALTYLLVCLAFTFGKRFLSTQPTDTNPPKAS